MIKPGNGLQEAYKIVDDNFGSTNNIEVIIDTGMINGVYEPSVLKAMEAFSLHMETNYPGFITRTHSLANIVKDSHQKLTDGSEANYTIPNSSALSTQVLSLFESADPQTRSMFVDDNWQIGRITLSGKSKSTMEYADIMVDLDKEIIQFFGPLKKQFPKVKK